MQGTIFLAIPGSLAEKQKGLLGLPAPPSGWGMLFLDTSAIHMVGMAFPIAVVCLDDFLRVIDILYGEIGNPKVSSSGTKHILELSLQDAARLNIRRTSQLRTHKLSPSCVLAYFC